MEIAKLITPAPDWSGGSFANRIDQAASFLFLHGYISQSQRTLITCKIERQFMDAIRRGEIVEAAQGMSTEGENSRSEVEGGACQPGPKDAPDA